MKKRTKAAAIVLAAAMSAGALAGCDLITTNVNKDYAQTIAEVNISRSENFADGEFAEYADVIETASITKRDMVAYFVSTGYSLMQSQGLTYHDTFNLIAETLVNRQVYLQYAMLYLLDNADGSDGLTVEGYTAAVEGAEEDEKPLAALGYFLTEDEREKARYDTCVMFNNSLDSQELNYIEEDDDVSSATSTRTTPTGVNTEDEDYFNRAYQIYTGANAAADCSGYEVQDGSTPTTRRKAYGAFLASLRSNDLIAAGEDTSKVEELSYFKLELENSYETALINKMSDMLEDQIRQTVTDEVAQEVYDLAFERQSLAFGSDTESFESALDGVSDTSFVLTAPEANYGFVINILIPFSAKQSLQLSNFSPDYGDKNGNSFSQRADLLAAVEGTDQRGAWFTGTEDYSFVVADSEVKDAYTGGDADRKYLFFEDSILESTQYERVPNYYGRYTYNGKVDKNEDDEYVLTPNRISIDAFLSEMEGYLGAAASAVTGESAYTVSEGKYVSAIGDDDAVTEVTDGSAYYARSVTDYYKADGRTVDYSKFVYYTGKLDFGTDGYDAGEIFLQGSAENTAFSVINELSFAYNTDTAGLNSYLGYAVTTGKTDYVPEFEYAAQYLCRQGAGSYAVVATDYGWHIMYCTFSFVSDGEGGVVSPYTFDASLKETEGTFSYLFYEAIVADRVSDYASTMQSEAIDTYSDCAVLYEDRYADLTGLDTAS